MGDVPEMIGIDAASMPDRGVVVVGGVPFDLDTPQGSVMHTLLREVKDSTALIEELAAERDAMKERVGQQVEWISEEDALPPVGELVLVAGPRVADDFWRLRLMWVGIAHEGVTPLPVKKGSKWPTDYSWHGSTPRDIWMITGDKYWAKIGGIAPPPGVELYIGRSGENLFRTSAALADDREDG